ncbi:MAG: NUDIX domain-containing protein [Bacteroides sp.]|nr:NUDIX domain-containing protein [Bacteroides sp.]
MKKIVRSINPHISVDCVIFGFSTSQLKVLLIQRDYLNEKGVPAQDHKLPGDFITTREDLDLAAARTLKELTGLQNIFLEPFAIFGKPNRISRKTDINWLESTTGNEIYRVVTSAYFALINISESDSNFALKNKASWIDVHQVPKLAFDHREIFEKGLRHLQNALRNEPIGFELLPEKFTIRKLQTLYEVILNCKLDNRNFRKKILKTKYLVQLDEKQAGVAHKPAHYYRFDKDKYDKYRKDSLGFNF